MSLKAIDMQLAVHKNSDAGLIQQQLRHKPEADQALLSGQTLKNATLQRQRSERPDASARAQIKDERSTAGRDSKKPSRKKAKEAEPGEIQDTSVHPYKGRHIDLTC